jgi:hypothetical protein
MDYKKIDEAAKTVVDILEKEEGSK